MKFDFRDKGLCHTTMEEYIDKFCNDFNVKKTRSTPARPDLFSIDVLRFTFYFLRNFEVAIAMHTMYNTNAYSCT